MSILVNSDNWGFNFVQGAEPTDPYEGLTWYDTTGQAYMEYHNSEWHEIGLLPTVVATEYGYCIGGYYAATATSTIERLTFPFDSGNTSAVGNLSATLYNTCGCNSSNYGYVLGGGNNMGSAINRILFPFDSGTSSEVGYLTTANRVDNNACNSSNYGYSINGFPTYTSQYSIIDRITFPFDSGNATNVGISSFPCARNECFNSSTHGYSCGGIFYTGDYYNHTRIDRIVFPFDSGTADNVGSLSGFREWGIPFNSSTYGYYCSGTNVASIGFSNVQRITFPFDSGTASDTGDTSTATAINAGCNSTNYGYIMGKLYSAVYRSSVERITFPFDSGTSSEVGTLTTAKGHTTGVDGTDFVRLFN